MKQRYELILNSSTHDYYAKSREGLTQAYRDAERVIAEQRDEIEMLAIYCVYYSHSGEKLMSEFVEEWDMEDMTCIDDRIDGYQENMDTTETDEATIEDAKFKGAGYCGEGHDYA